MSTQAEETAPEAAPEAPAKRVAKKKPTRKAKPATAEKTKTNKRKAKGPGKYSQLVIDAIKTLGERNGSSLFKIYNEAKKASWFDQQHGRVYLRYSIRALLRNDTLVQVKGLGANGSFKLNKKKFTSDTKESSVKQRKTAKPVKKTAKNAENKKKGVRGVKKATPVTKKSSKPKKADKSAAVATKKANKPKKAKQTKKTVKKA
ncbi:histone H1.10 [Tachysurus fulvidraco]|uniref:histone H1.10 n=1 Tax=Tachysurus fulvidraco TaxID=1234273 RepID=UPI000F4D6361|nr:histone H1.10 [Tachysurus fulvidraco]